MKKCFFLSLLAILMILTGCKQEKVINDLPRANAAPEMVAAIDSFVQATKTRPVAPDSITLHSIMILKHGEVVYEKWFNGHSAETPHPMFSVSKTFTAIAVGLAINEGKLNLTDPVVKFFPDQLPDEPSDYLKVMTVRDLLTMTCGHDEEPNSSRADSVDWVENFLAWPVKHQPGEYYLYNSIGTYMLSAIVQKVTGEKLIDYLDTRLFQPLNINRPTWDESPQGINCGGWGLNIKTEDMAKLGQLFLQKGKWNGKQVVPAEWLKEMSSYQVPSAPSGTRFEDLEKAGLNKDNNEWVQGYGYQMWICRHNAFRADGYAGQYIMVFLDRDAVLVLTTSSSLYQPYIDLIWEFLLPVL
ncbi:MAG: serine hydrolase [Bacteroidaceae bacterium]|nr:serine hydrolase [Bacteroidaceae bacterium]